MTEGNPPPVISPLSNTLFFTSLKDLSFDYTLPLKSSLNHFCHEQRGEASRNLFEYLCYKIVQKQITEKGINDQIAIISEKYLLSKDCVTNLSNLNASQKKFIFIPIFNTSTHKWNAIIFVHLERQILQYRNKTPTEPIVAKIISSNINSEEDDYLLNTTMDKIENSFNFTSPEDIQFEVDSINICDQPNTSVFLLNFIEGLVSQENDTDIIMNYIMKLYDESCNTNSIGSNNYFVSFNKENVLFQNLIENYINEIKIYAKNNGIITDNQNIDDINLTNIFDLIKFQPEEEDEIESEEEALKIVEKNNEEALKQMEEQELFFTNNMNPPFILNMDGVNNVPPKTILGLIQEVENESDEDTEQKNDINNKSLIKRDEVNIITEDEEGINELELSINNKEKNENNEEINEENSEKEKNIKNENNNNNIIQNMKESDDGKINDINKENVNEIKNIDNNEIKKNKINGSKNGKNNKKLNYRNIQTENKVNISMPKLSNKLEKMKNEIISNLSKDSKVLRGSDRLKNNTLEKLKILTEGTNENNNLSKSLTNSNIIPDNNINESTSTNTTTYNVINLQRNQKYNNSSFYLSKGTNSKPKNKNISNNNNQITNKEDDLIISNDNSNMNFLEDRSNIIKNKKKDSKKDINYEENNNLIFESNFNKIKNINTNLINNINEDNIKNIKKITGKSEIKTNTQITQKNQNISKESNKSNNCNRGKNTIIINETSNNNTVINFIEIKNNFDTNKSNNLSDNENEIPEDGVINPIIETFSPNKTLTRMKKENIDNDFLINKNRTYKGKTAVNFDIFSGTINPKDIKLTLLNNYLYGSDSLNTGNINKEENNDFHHSVEQLNHCKLDDENIYGDNIEKDKEINIKEKNYNIQNKISKDNTNENNNQKKDAKKLKNRGGPEKKKNKYNGDKNNIELYKEYKSSNNCSLNMSNNLNCGCAGINEGCFIF